MKAKDFVGRRFGMILVLREVENYISPSGNKKRRFECRCDCGKTWRVVGQSLQRGQTDCGCQRDYGVTHGHARKGRNTPTYRTWASMIQRCNNANNRASAHYGSRGITVCDRWLVFENFLADMGERPGPGMSIERKDVNGGYEPSNCMWANASQQAKNKQKTLRVGGKTITEAAKSLGLSHSAIVTRMKRGWDARKAMTTPTWHKSLSGFVRAGEDHPMAKLTQAKVNDIRSRIEAGHKLASIAREFDVSVSMISRIKVGKAWKA